MSLDTVCRLCLYKTPTNFPLLKNSSYRMLEALTSIKIQPTDEILRICFKCNLKLKLAYNIQQDIIRANERLRNGYLNKLLIEEQSGFINRKDICLNDAVVMKNDNLKSVQLPTTCIICNSVFDENSMKLHLKQHFDDSQHCDLCNQIFSNIQSYQQHLLEHPKYKKYKCLKCEITFRYKSLYNVHMEKVHAKSCVSLEPTELKDNVVTSTSDKINGLQKTEIEYNIQQDTTQDDKKFLTEHNDLIKIEENSLLNNLKMTTDLDNSTCTTCNSSHRRHLEQPQHEERKCDKCKSLNTVHQAKVHTNGYSGSMVKSENKSVRKSQRLKKSAVNTVDKLQNSKVQQDTTQSDQKINEVYSSDTFLTEHTCDLIKTEEDPLLDNIVDVESKLRHLLKQPQHEKYKCDKCESTFRYKYLLNVHKAQVHPDCKSVEIVKSENNGPRIPPKRNIKNKISPRKENIQTKLPKEPVSLCQIKKITKPKDPYTCNICFKQFNNASNWSKHIQNHKSGPQMCEHCGRTYAHIGSLRDHIKYKHKKDGVYECKKCQITFESGPKLKQHWTRDHQRAVKICETCGKNFFLNKHLQQHIRATHTNERPHVCEVCKKSFPRRFNLDAHRRQHTNETPYRCEVCGDGFKHNVSLKTHRKSKHNIVEEVTCPCEICGKGFCSKHALKTHMRKQH